MTASRVITEYDRARIEINSLYKKLKDKSLPDADLNRVRTMVQVLGLALTCLKDMRATELEARIERLEAGTDPDAWRALPHEQRLAYLDQLKREAGETIPLKLAEVAR